MKKIITLLLLPMFITSCDSIGSNSVKNLIDLTPRLEVESSTPLKIKSGANNPLTMDMQKSYKIAKNTIIGKPAIAKNVVYSVDDNGYASAFSLKEKRILWATDLAATSSDRHFSSGGVLYSNDRLYITNGSRDLMILDAKTGHEVIRKEFPDIVRNKPVMANDRILLVQTINNQLVSYDIKSSKLLWINEGGVEIISMKNHIYPVIYKDHALVSFSSGELLFVDINTGQPKWNYSIANSGDSGLPSFDPSVLVSSPIISENYAYFATSNGQIVKLDLDNGAAAWVKNADDVQSISLLGDNLFITNNARQVAALSTHDGKINWVGDLISIKERNAKRPKPALFQEPFLTKTNIGYAVNVVASNGELYQFETNKWGVLSSSPNIIKIEKNVRYQWICCCSGALRLITNKHIKY